MTTTTTPVFTPTGHGLGFGGILRSEWIKLRSIRSTAWCEVILVLLIIGFGALLSSALSADGVPAGSAAQSLAVQAVTIGVALASLVVCVLGVLIISGEYGTGMIRSTLTAVPTRLPALFAKALIFAVVTFVVSALAFAIVVPISVALLSGKGLEVDLGDLDYWLALLGAVGYLVLVGLIAFSIGAIVRNTAAGIAVTLGLVMAAPIVLNIIGSLTDLTWLSNITTVLPSGAGDALYSYPGDAGGAAAAPVVEGLWTLEPWQGLAVLAAWVVALFTTAAVLLKRRDA
jgi:ABC-2 type transport system permease protein